MKNYDFGINPKYNVVVASRPYRIYIRYPSFSIALGDKINRILLLINFEL